MRRAAFDVALATFLGGATAQAHRPLDGTDATVTDVGVLTVEAAPVQFHRSAGESWLVPGLGLNFGFAVGWEVAVDGRQWVALEAMRGEDRVDALDAAVLLKWLVREGSLQEQAGVSVAIEAALRLPEVHGDDGVGGDATAAVSYRWSFGTVHVNQGVGRSRLGNLVLSNGLVLDGPAELVVRPIVELSSEQELDEGASYALLVGAIATASESLAFDLAFRAAHEDEEGAYELRLGLTWDLQVFEVASD